MMKATYEPQAVETRWYSVWEDAGTFRPETNPDGQPFSIVIPPPNVTGSLHMGHALDLSIQDAIIRRKRMQGYAALWIPGTDHAGIATQNVVERELANEGMTRDDLGREAFVERVWAWKRSSGNRITEQMRTMGFSPDWTRERFTMDEGLSGAVRKVFVELYHQGLIYRGNRIINWCPRCHTAISDIEVEHEDEVGELLYIKYPFLEGDGHVTVATTRPETMLGDTAVAVHPDPARQLDSVEAELKEKLAAAPAKEKQPLAVSLEALAERRQTILPQLLQLREMAARGVQVELPLTGRTIPLIVDEWAKPELGSGCVKITPAHDENDYQVWQRNESIGAINILNPDGTLNDSAPKKYRGLTMKKARTAVIEDMEAPGLLVEIEDREIDLAHSDRSKTPIEPYLADQWFVKMDKLAQSAMDAVTNGRVKIVPERYAKGYLDWLSEKRDWPVGRQLWWGHRIPVWKKQFSNDAEKDAIEQEAVQLALAESLHQGSEDLNDVHSSFIHDWDPETSSGNAYFCLRDDKADVAAIEAAGYRQEEEVLDTWFSSALWPHSTLGWPEETPELKKFYPTSVLITTRDIITLWVARMVLMGEYNMGEVPFSEVYITPKILDGYGETMSKSKGNGVDPLDVIDKFGADALRFGIAYMTTDTQDVKLPVEFECPYCQVQFKQTKKNRRLTRIDCEKCGEPFGTQWAESDEDKALPRGAVVNEKFELGRNFCNKLWNAARFTLMNLEGYEAAPVTEADLLLEDRWLLSRLATVTDEVTTALESFRYADAARALYCFAWDEFCSFYVEMTKARFAVPEQRSTAQRVIAHALDTLLRLLHPITPFVTEEVWQLLGEAAPNRGLPTPAKSAESVCVAEWPKSETGRIDKAIEEQFGQFQAFMKTVREFRTRQTISPKISIDCVFRCDENTTALLRPMQDYFKQMANANIVEIGPNASLSCDRSMSLRVDRASDNFVEFDSDQFKDVDKERASLEKERDQLAKFTKSIEEKLGNENFVSRAPAEVVEAERDKLAEVGEQLAAVEAALAKLG